MISIISPYTKLLCFLVCTLGITDAGKGSRSFYNMQELNAARAQEMAMISAQNVLIGIPQQPIYMPSQNYIPSYNVLPKYSMSSSYQEGWDVQIRKQIAVHIRENMYRLLRRPNNYCYTSNSICDRLFNYLTQLVYWRTQQQYPRPYTEKSLKSIIAVSIRKDINLLQGNTNSICYAQGYNLCGGLIRYLDEIIALQNNEINNLLINNYNMYNPNQKNWNVIDNCFPYGCGGSQSSELVKTSFNYDKEINKYKKVSSVSLGQNGGLNNFGEINTMPSYSSYNNELMDSEKEKLKKTSLKEVNNGKPLLESGSRSMNYGYQPYYGLNSNVRRIQAQQISQDLKRLVQEVVVREGVDPNLIKLSIFGKSEPSGSEQVKKVVIIGSKNNWVNPMYYK